MFARLKLFSPFLAVLALLALMLAPAGIATAEPPVSIPGGTYIVDNANVLGGQKADVQKAIDELGQKHGMTFFVVYVDSFDGQTGLQWGTEVGNMKQLGTGDALLVVAVKDGKFALLADQNMVPPTKNNYIQTNVVKPQLAQSKQDNSNWGQAAIDTAAALGDAAGGGKGDVPNPTGGFVALGVGGAVVVGGAGTALYLRNKRKKNAAAATAQGYGSDGQALDPNAGMSIAELRTKAGSLLIAADDAIKTSEHEIGFAQASYGDEAVKPFQAALASAKTHLSESFKLQQQLDDEIPDTIEEQRTWLGDIIARSEEANAALDAEKASFDELRELERTAPQVLAGIREQSAAAQTSLAAAESTLAALTQQYSDTAVEPVRDNVAQARERLDFVATAATEADAKLAAGDTAAAAVAVKAAEESLLQCGVLLEAIAKTDAAIREAANTLTTALPAALGDLDQAKSMVASEQFARFAPTVQAAETALNDVRMNATAKSDPVAQLAAVQSAHSQLDELLTGIRDQQQQALRAQAALQQALAGAQATISTAEDFIAARRGGVGSEARTRLSEAERNFDYAVSISGSDPVNSLAYAQQAQQLAKQAIQYAQNDVNNFGGGGRGGGYGGGGGSMGGGMGGAILGGIIGGLLSGGGGGFGGGGFGGGGGGGGFGGGGGGGFGGGGGNF